MQTRAADLVRRASVAGRVKRVSVKMLGEKCEIEFHVPVGMAAVEFIRDSRKVGAATGVLAGYEQSFGVDVPKQQDDEDGAKRARLLADAYDKLAADDEAEEKLKLLADARESMNEAVLEFTFKWLPRVCPEFAGLDDDGIANVLRQAGMADSPLVHGLLSILQASQAPGGEDDGLDDLPFPDRA